MTARSIRPEDLDACCALGSGQWLVDVVRTLWKEGRSSPDLCFVTEQDGTPVARVFFHRGSPSTEYHVFGLHIDPSADFHTAGTALLTAALSGLTKVGATKVEHAIYDIYEREPARMQRLLEEFGFRLYQQKRRYVWKDAGIPVAVPLRLEFRSFAIIGEDAFTDAARRVTQGTLDQADQTDMKKYGPDAAGRMYVALLKDIEFLSDEWQLGFLSDGRLCGLVVPQRLPFEDEGTINYIGVVPELRGSGYGFDLLMKGTALLQRRGLKTVIAETDVLNRPPHAHLERAGYAHKGTLKALRLDPRQPANG